MNQPKWNEWNEWNAGWFMKSHRPTSWWCDFEKYHEFTVGFLFNTPIIAWIIEWDLVPSESQISLWHSEIWPECQSEIWPIRVRSGIIRVRSGQILLWWARSGEITLWHSEIWPGFYRCIKQKSHCKLVVFFKITLSTRWSVWFHESTRFMIPIKSWLSY